MASQQAQSSSSASSSDRDGGFGFGRLIRLLPIRWRILSIAVLNVAVAFIIAILLWDGAKVLGAAWKDLRQVRESDQLLVIVESETSRLQNLIQRYFIRPDSVVSAEILLSQEALLITIRSRLARDPILASSVDGLVQAIGRLIDGYGALRASRSNLVRTYENEVLDPAKDLASTYATIEIAVSGRDAPIWSSLVKSREAFSAALVAANSYYLSLAPSAAEEARNSLLAVERAIPGMLNLTENQTQRAALATLRERTEKMRQGLDHLVESITEQTRLLRDAIDGNQAAMLAIIDPLSKQMREREQHAQEKFDETLNNAFLKVVVVAGTFLSAIVIIGVAIARSISGSLHELTTSMISIVAGNYSTKIRGLDARDDIGKMARALSIFRDNAIAKQRAEDELRKSKERAETALSDLRATQRSLIEAEKLAALGGLVAGIAHEVNNPVGISLTVASSLAHRCKTFATEIESGQLRRSRLTEFVEGSRDASNQLVANLQRAGELIQSFKQVAVDRSHDERRQFDLQQSSEQIVSSLRPGIKKSNLTLVVNIPPGIMMDSYPGHYGQVLTNLFINAVTHAFKDGQSGTITISGLRRGAREVEVVFADDGRGMHEDVQRRAFDPFFTTRRHLGGTGLGLNIVYNLITRRLGGRVSIVSALGKGTAFHITIPLVAPAEEIDIAETQTLMDQQHG